MAYDWDFVRRRQSRMRARPIYDRAYREHAGDRPDQRRRYDSASGYEARGDTGYRRGFDIGPTVGGNDIELRSFRVPRGRQRFRTGW